MNDAINQSNMIEQANSLVGKTVQIVDPNNPARLLTGLVSSANFTSGSATITVNGKEYPLGLVASVTDGANVSDANTIKNKKLSELNNAQGITNGYITLTVQGEGYERKHTYINVKSDMKVSDLINEIEKLNSFSGK